MRLDLYSELYAATGGVSGEGVRKALGNPKFEHLELLLRETIQNSWDARIGDGPVKYGMNLRQFQPDHLKVLERDVMWMRPDFWGLIAWGLEISDRNTRGLSGPTRADVPIQENERGFAAFFYDMGRPAALAAGGGTYGYGKASLYAASSLPIGTICVHTRCATSNGKESRFLVSAVGEAYDNSGRRYTGRHWLGKKDNGQHHIDPLTNDQADKFALSLGMEIATGDCTGTTILVLSPRLPNTEDGQPPTPESTVAWLADCAMWFAWPKIVSIGMAISVLMNGQPESARNPEDHSVLKGFVEAFRMLERPRNAGGELLADSWNSKMREVRCERPKKRLGTMAVRLFSPASVATGANDKLPNPCHHIALLRKPQLIVDYRPTAEMADPQLQYAGVFQVSDECDSAFAKAEPPAHDAWDIESLESTEKTFVGTALRKIDIYAREIAKPPGADIGAGTSVPLGELANYLGGLVPDLSVEDDSDDRTLAGGGSGNGGRRRSVELKIGEQYIEAADGIVQAVVPFHVTATNPDCDITLTAEATVVVQDGTAERETPSQAAMPRVLGWRNCEGMKHDKKASVDVKAGDIGKDQRWELLVAIPGDVVVSVSIKAISAEGEQ